MARSPKEKPRAFARGLPGWLRWDFSAAPPAAFSNLRLKTQKATAPMRGRLKKARDDGPREFRRERLDFLFLVCSSEASLFGGDHLVGGARDCRETTRSDQALESAQEARRSGRGRTPHPDPRMLFGEGSVGEGDGEARGVMSVALRR